MSHAYRFQTGEDIVCPQCDESVPMESRLCPYCETSLK